jgi:hypothetical protein
MTVLFNELDVFFVATDEWKRGLFPTLLEHFLAASDAFENGLDFIEFERSFTKGIMLGNIHDCKYQKFYHTFALESNHH